MVLTTSQIWSSSASHAHSMTLQRLALILEMALILLLPALLVLYQKNSAIKMCPFEIKNTGVIVTDFLPWTFSTGEVIVFFILKGAVWENLVFNIGQSMYGTRCSGVLHSFKATMSDYFLGWSEQLESSCVRLQVCFCCY